MVFIDSFFYGAGVDGVISFAAPSAAVLLCTLSRINAVLDVDVDNIDSFGERGAATTFGVCTNLSRIATLDVDVDNGDIDDAAGGRVCDDTAFGVCTFLSMFSNALTLFVSLDNTRGDDDGDKDIRFVFPAIVGAAVDVDADDGDGDADAFGVCTVSSIFSNASTLF
jgi:hypothetical protein